MHTLIETAVSGKLLKSFTNATIRAMAKLDNRKHQNAVMVVYHAAQFGECFALNALYNAFKVNDQSAFKRWIVDNFSYTEEGSETPLFWLDHTSKKGPDGKPIGWRVIKGREAHRKDVYDFDKLMSLAPFYAIDLSKPKNWDLNALLEVIIKASDTVTKKANKEGIKLPAGFATALEEAKKQAVLNHIEEAAETVTNENTKTNKVEVPKLLNVA